MISSGRILNYGSKTGDLGQDRSSYYGDDWEKRAEGGIGGELQGGVADIPCQGLQDVCLGLQLQRVVAAWLDESVNGPAHLHNHKLSSLLIMAYPAVR